MPKYLFPSATGPLTQRQLYDALTDPTLFEVKLKISVIQEPMLLLLESKTCHQYRELKEAMMKLPL